MSKDNFAESAQSFGTRFVEEYSRAMQVYADLLDNIAKSGRDNAERGAIGSSELQRRYTEFVISHAPKVLAQISQASMNYYTTLADLGMQTLNGYVENVLQVEEPAKTRAPKSTAKKPAPKKAAPKKAAPKKAAGKAKKKATRK